MFVVWTFVDALVVVEEDVVLAPAIVADAFIPLNSSCDSCGNKFRDAVVMTGGNWAVAVSVVPDLTTRGAVWVFVEVVVVD